MAVPQRRISKTRKRTRRTHFHLTVAGLVTCPNCGETIKAHHVCPKCGFYAGKATYLNGKVVTKEEVKKEVNSGKKSVRKAKEAKEAKANEETK